MARQDIEPCSLDGNVEDESVEVDVLPVTVAVARAVPFGLAPFYHLYLSWSMRTSRPTPDP